MTAPATLPDCLLQVLMEVRARLEEITERRFEDAVARRDHAAAVRFARLYKPLGKQVRAWAVWRVQDLELGQA